MANYQKEWKKEDFYNFSIEFNRIEKYNKYIEHWLKEYYGLKFNPLIHVTSWTNYDIIDLNDYNRVKGNINELLNQMKYTNKTLNISNEINQTFNNQKANEIESALITMLDKIGQLQFNQKITNLYVCGSTNVLGI